MLRAAHARRTMRLLGTAVATGVLSATLLATPVSAGGVNGVKASSSSSTKATEAGYRSQKGADASVNGVVNGLRSGYKVKSSGGTYRSVNGV